MNRPRTKEKGDKKTFHRHVWPVLNDRYAGAAGKPSQLLVCAKSNLPEKPLRPPVPYRSPSNYEEREDHALHPLVPNPGVSWDPKLLADDANRGRAFNAKSRL